MVKIGDWAPDFCLPDQSSSKVCLKDFRGRWVVLYFYPKDNTPGCTMEATQFTGAFNQFKKSDAAILGVSPDSVESHKRFAQKHDLKVTLLSDTDREVLKKYGAWQLKKLYGREFMGVVRSTFLIDPDGRIGHIWPKVRIKGHVNDVKERLRVLSSGG